MNVLSYVFAFYVIYLVCADVRKRYKSIRRYAKRTARRSGQHRSPVRH